MEELGEWEPTAVGAGLDTVLLASPITPDERLAVLCARSRGFVYGVNLLGTTGERSSLSDMSLDLAKRLKATTDRPAIMGFGISTPDQARTVAEHADGVVVASALMRRRLDGASPLELGDDVARLRAALDAG
jgi:tryptophan synthase alpha chain